MNLCCSRDWSNDYWTFFQISPKKGGIEVPGFPLFKTMVFVAAKTDPKFIGPSSRSADDFTVRKHWSDNHKSSPKTSDFGQSFFSQIPSFGVVLIISTSHFWDWRTKQTDLYAACSGTLSKQKENFWKQICDFFWSQKAPVKIGVDSGSKFCQSIFVQSRGLNLGPILRAWMF